MSHDGERRRQTQQSKLGSFKNLRKGENPWRVGSLVDLGTKVRKSSDITQVPATPSPDH